MPDYAPNHHTHEASKARVSPGLFVPERLIHRLTSLAVDLLFPPRCAGCGQVDSVWCSRCAAEVAAIPMPRGLRAVPPLKAVAATALHSGKIREAVQALKYENARRVAEPLGERLYRQLLAHGWTVDILAPVPLHTTRLAERGYNQAQLLCQNIAERSGLPCMANTLRRERNTQSQVTMNATERLTNVEGAFRADPATVSNRVVLIVDDVYTTGATLSACAEALLAAGAQAVYGLTVTAARL